MQNIVFFMFLCKLVSVYMLDKFQSGNIAGLKGLCLKKCFDGYGQIFV